MSQERDSYVYCAECACGRMRLHTDEGRWYATCANCTTVYELIPDGNIQLVKRGGQQ